MTVDQLMLKSIAKQNYEVKMTQTYSVRIPF